MKYLGVGIGLGLCFGAALGAAMQNVAMGVAIGVALGVTFGHGVYRIQPGIGQEGGISQTAGPSVGLVKGLITNQTDLLLIFWQLRMSCVARSTCRMRRAVVR